MDILWILWYANFWLRSLTWKKNYLLILCKRTLEKQSSSTYMNAIINTSPLSYQTHFEESVSRASEWKHTAWAFGWRERAPTNLMRTPGCDLFHSRFNIADLDNATFWAEHTEREGGRERERVQRHKWHQISLYLCTPLLLKSEPRAQMERRTFKWIFPRLLFSRRVKCLFLLYPLG